MNDVKHLTDEDLLKPQNMIRLYARGAFPMADDPGNISWYMPDIRTIIPLKQFNLPRSLKQFMDKTNFEYRYDHDPLSVIQNCSTREKTWISPKLIKAYQGLIKLGHLHSVEVYQKNKLVGGLYGITYKGAFFGESMFSHVSQASKCALVKLIERLNQKNFILLDVQYQTEHLKMFGAKEISFEGFYYLRVSAYQIETEF